MGDFQILKQKFDKNNDEELVRLAKSNNPDAQEYLLRKYKKYVKAKARVYFLIGGDKEDIIQEGMIGLFQAIRDFDPTHESTFKGFAQMCITRQIITAIKTANRQKHSPLNSYISLNKPIYSNESTRTLLDILEERKVYDPERLIISNEQFNLIHDIIGEVLSDFETKVLMNYLQGKSYKGIAGDLKRDIKSIDNALQRVKKKLEKRLEVH